MTRVLRLLALWVSQAYSQGFKGHTLILDWPRYRAD